MKILTYLTILGMGISTASAATNADVKIGVVDMQQAIQSVKEGKSARSKLEKEFNKKKKELQNEEAQIKKMHEEFQKKSLVMSEKARAEKQQEIQGRILKLQQKTMQSQQEIQQKEKDLTQPIITKLRKIIKDMAEKQGYSVVLEKNENTVLYFLDKDDLTTEVIKRFNKS